MSLFRSEEHVEAWLGRTRNLRGAVVPLAQVWELAKRWYVDPRDPGWRPRTRDESQSVINAAGLRGEFWELPR
jgi:hypothetical protein